MTWLLLVGVGVGIVALVMQPPKLASASTKGLDGFTGLGGLGYYTRG